MTVEEEAPQSAASAAMTAATMTTAMLKAFAHPLRQRLFRLTQQHRYLRAADAAAKLGEPANKISFHLRVLAEAGLIHEAPERARDGRDRVWTATEGAWTIGSTEDPVVDEALGDIVMRSFASEHQSLVARLGRWAPEYTSGRDTVVRGSFTRTTAHLTRAEFEELMAAIHRLLRDAKAAHDEDADDTRFYEIDIVAADDTI